MCLLPCLIAERTASDSRSLNKLNEGSVVLTQRKMDILKLIVGNYIRDATPVASERIARTHGLGVSPATIRNDVVELELEGFVTRPHPSAGSVPLNKGYRLYVESIYATEREPIPQETQVSIKQRLIKVERDVEEWGRVAAAILAGLVGNMAITTFPKARESRIKHIDLVELQDILVLLIVVFEETRLKRQLLRLEKPAKSEELQVLANRLNHMLQGLNWKEIKSKEKGMDLSSLEEEVVGSTVVMLKEEDRSLYRDHYVDGLRNLLAQPEFTENEMAYEFIRGVEEGTLAQAILAEVPEGGIVRVVIGEESQGDVLWPLSVVIGKYGLPSEAAGVIGAVGPVRMEYKKAITSVELMVGLMGELVGVIQAS